MDAKEFWERASEYPANKEECYPDHARLQQFDKAKGKVVLEYGCGGGGDTLSYLRRGATVKFADFVPKNIDTTYGRIWASNFEASTYEGLLLKDSAKIPLKDKSVDIVSSNGVLHHITDPLPVLKEFYRVLKKGGSLYVMMYTENLWNSFADRIKELTKTWGISEFTAFGWCTDNEGYPYARAYTEKEGTELIEKAGFSMSWLEAYAPTLEDRKANRFIFRMFKADKK